MEKLSETNKDLPKFDPSEYFKMNGEYRPIIGNIVVYRDMDHMTNTYSETFGPILGKEIKSVVKNREWTLSTLYFTFLFKYIFKNML